MTVQGYGYGVRTIPVRPLLVFVMLAPLIPRPTVSGSMAYLAPASLIFLLAAFVIGVVPHAKLDVTQSRTVGAVFLLLMVPTFIYGFRILAQSQWSEEGYFAAKVAMSLGSLIILVWLYVADVDVQRVYHALLIGYLLLAVLMVYVGVTGDGLLEPARPSRSYGFRTPLFKAAGIPRSYGELAIFSSVVLAYLLVYRRAMGRVLWLSAVLVWCLTVLVAQSRTGFIASAVVLLGFIGLHVFVRRTAAFVMIIGVLSIPVVAQSLYPSLQSEQLLSDVIGESTIQENVDIRVNMYATAFSHLLHPGMTLLAWGIDRERWLAESSSLLGRDIVLHNYFLSTLMFFGILGGLVSLVGLVLLPVWRLASSGLVSRDQEVVFLATMGTITSLQFYEGFFSVILMLQLALLWYTAYGGGDQDARARVGLDGDRQAPRSAPAGLKMTIALT